MCLLGAQEEWTRDRVLGATLHGSRGGSLIGQVLQTHQGHLPVVLYPDLERDDMSNLFRFSLSLLLPMGRTLARDGERVGRGSEGKQN